MATEPLAKALSTDFSSPIAKQYMASQKPIFEQKQQLSTELGDVERKIAEGKQRQKEIEAEGRVAAGEQFVQRRGEAQQRMQEGLAAAPIEPFVPTRDTAQDIAGLFSLIGVIGMVAGKGNAMQAMGAMNGMLEGHRKGRADLYKQELSTYEKNFKALIKKHDELRTEFKDAVETYAVDKELGEQKAMLAAAKSESPILQELVRKGEIVRANTLLDDVGKSIGKATELDQKERESIRREAAADRRAKMQLESRERLARERMEAQNKIAQAKAEQKANASGAKPPPKEIVAQNTLRNNVIPKIEQALPEIDRLQKEGKWSDLTTLLAIDPRVAEYQFRDDPGALDVILTLAYFRSKEFETAGKALTRMEDKILAPIVRGDLRVYEGIKNAMEDGLKTMKTEQRALEYSYPFIKTYNEALRMEEGGGTSVDMNDERGKAYQAIENGADIAAVKKRFKERTGEDLN